MLANSSHPVRNKKYLLKLKTLREEQVPQNSSMFNMGSSNSSAANGVSQELKKFQTIATMDNSLTLQSQLERTLSNSETKSVHEQTIPTLLPKIQTRDLNGIVRDIDNQQLPDSPVIGGRKIRLGSHVSDPVYMKLDKTLSKRVNARFKAVSGMWHSKSLKRKGGKSLLDRSLEKASISLKHINQDSEQRANNPCFEDLMRDLIGQKEKKMARPALMRPDIDGLRGRGGKVVPLFQEVHMVEEVYRWDRST